MNPATQQVKRCPECGKRMVKRFYDEVTWAYTVAAVWDHWCGCGHTERGGYDDDGVADARLRAEWEEANKA